MSTKKKASVCAACAEKSATIKRQCALIRDMAKKLEASVDALNKVKLDETKSYSQCLRAMTQRDTLIGHLRTFGWTCVFTENGGHVRLDLQPPPRKPWYKRLFS